MTLSLDQIFSIIGGTAGFVIIPWAIFITLNIFNMKQQIALLKQEIELLNKISAALGKMDLFKSNLD